MQKVFQDSCCQQMHKEISVLNILDCKYNFFFSKAFWIHCKIKMLSLSSVMLILGIFSWTWNPEKQIWQRKWKSGYLLFPLMTVYFSVCSKKENTRLCLHNTINLHKQAINKCSMQLLLGIKKKKQKAEKNLPNPPINIYLSHFNGANHSSQFGTEYSWIYSRLLKRCMSLPSHHSWLPPGLQQGWYCWQLLCGPASRAT